MEVKRKRVGEESNKTKSEAVVKILTNYICDLQYEIADEKQEENVKEESNVKYWDVQKFVR